MSTSAVEAGALSEPRGWRARHSALSLLLAGAFVGLGLYIPYEAVGSDGDASNARLLAWALMAGILVAFLAVLSAGISGLKRGFLIDSRNRISLAKVQMAAWTILLLSAYAAAALGNLGTGQPNPLDVAIPQELWLAMGISTTSLIGAPLILSPKKQDRLTNERDREFAAQVALLEKQGVHPASVDRTGSLITYKRPEDSRWADLFQGEETGNAGLVDLSKVQMFFFTAVLVLVYAVGIGDTLGDVRGDVSALPGLDESMIALLGISHAGYLGKKALPKPPA